MYISERYRSLLYNARTFLYAVMNVRAYVQKSNKERSLKFRIRILKLVFLKKKNKHADTRQPRSAVDRDRRFCSKTRPKINFPSSRVSECSLHCQLVCALSRIDVKAVAILCPACDVWNSANSTSVWPNTHRDLIGLFTEMKPCMFFIRIWMNTLAEAEK
jgi:hypothetical protein